MAFPIQGLEAIDPEYLKREVIDYTQPDADMGY